MKTCTVCQQTKTLDLYHNCKKFKDGKYPQCKECKSAIDKAYYLKNQDKVKSKAKEYYSENKEVILASIDKQAKKEYRKQYYQLNKDYENLTSQQYKLENKDQVLIRKKEYKKLNKDKINKYRRNKRKNDPVFKVGLVLRNRLNSFIKNKDLSKSKSFDEYIGCTKEKLIEHLESQFTKGMTWENHGEYWEIDHIIPFAAAKNENMMFQLAHYRNLQPLPKHIHKNKIAKMTKCWQKLTRDINIDKDMAAGMPFNLSVSDFVLSEEKISLEHREFIERYEWLGTIGFGVRHCFTARYQGNLAGVVLMGEPNSREFGEKEVLIQRGAVSSWAPKNLNSKLVMFACNWMVKNTDKRYFTAYSDPEAGEIGTIYQACNFDYLGQEYGTGYMYKLPDGSWKNSRYFTRTSTMKKWAKELGIEWKPEWSKDNGFQRVELIPQVIKDYAKKKQDECPKKKQPKKGKYVLLINYGKEKIKKTWQSKPYPKRSTPK